MNPSDIDEEANAVGATPLICSRRLRPKAVGRSTFDRNLSWRHLDSASSRRRWGRDAMGWASMEAWREIGAGGYSFVPVE